MEHHRFLALHHGESKRDVAVYGYIQCRDQFYSLKCSVSLSSRFENGRNCSCPGGCRGNVACYLPIMVANSWYIDVCDHLPIGLPKMQDLKSLTLRRRSFSEWGTAYVTFSFTYKGSLYLIYEHLHPIATQIPQDGRPKIVYSRLTFISGWGTACFSLVFDYEGSKYIRKGQRCTNVNILRFTIGYLNTTTNRNPRKPELEIGNDGSSQTRHNLWVDRYRSRVGLPGCSGLGWSPGVEPNRTILAVRIQTTGWLPGPVANTM
jgi:hypothetical protein